MSKKLYDAEKAPRDQQIKLKAVLEKGDFADFEIRCRGKTFPVHKVILGSQSEYFKAALGRNFREGREGFIQLDEEEPDTVQRVLAWIYHPGLAISKESQLLWFRGNEDYPPPYHYMGKMIDPVLEAKVYIAADKMNMIDLGQACLGNLIHFDFSKNLPSFTQTVEVAYGTDTPQELRDIVVCAAHHPISGIANSPNATSQTTFKDALYDFPAFSNDFILRCQHTTKAYCSWTGKKAVVECPNGDHHNCGGICRDIDITTVRCRCGALRPQQCKNCNGSGKTAGGHRNCRACEGRGMLGPLNVGSDPADHVCYLKVT